SWSRVRPGLRAQRRRGRRGRPADRVRHPQATRRRPPRPGNARRLDRASRLSPDTRSASSHIHRKPRAALEAERGSNGEAADMMSVVEPVIADADGLRRADGSPVRVLVVDDEPSLADLLASVLRYEGWNIRTAGDGASAVRTARDFQP